MGGGAGALCNEFSSSYSYFDFLFFVHHATLPSANGFILQIQSSIDLG